MFFLGILSIQCKIKRDRPTYRLDDRTVDRDRRVGHLWYSVLCNVSIPTCNALDFTYIAVTRNTQIHEKIRAYIRGDSREYTPHGANAFALMKHKRIRQHA